MNLLVTTTIEPAEETLLKAKQLAERLSARLVSRRNDSMVRLKKKYNDPYLLVVTQTDIKWFPDDQPPLYFHPSTGLVRVKRLMKGEPDILMNAAGTEPGDIILDCTAGLASDSIVFSYMVGSEGKVISLESESLLSVLLEEGLQTYVSDYPEVNEAMRRIQVHNVHHLDFLRKLEDKSVDIVYFDPMFRHPVEESSSIAPLRGAANLEPLSLEAVNHAKRVARKSVVLKELRSSEEFERLGFQDVRKSNTKIAYGVIQL